MPLVEGVKPETPPEEDEQDEAVQEAEEKPPAESAPPAANEDAGVGSSSSESEESESESEPEAEATVPGLSLCSERYYHGFISRERADGSSTTSLPVLNIKSELLAGKPDSTFLIRQHKDGNPDAFIISVVFKGKSTHHILSRPSTGQDFSLNKRPTGVDSIEKVRACNVTYEKKYSHYVGPQQVYDQAAQLACPSD